MTTMDTIIDDITDIDTKLNNAIGHSPAYTSETVFVAWTSLITACIITFVLFTFSPALSGFGIMTVGAILGFFRYPLGFIAENTIGLTSIVVIFMLGILVLIVGAKKT